MRPTSRLRREGAFPSARGQRRGPSDKGAIGPVFHADKDAFLEGYAPPALPRTSTSARSHRSTRPSDLGVRKVAASHYRQGERGHAVSGAFPLTSIKAHAAWAGVGPKHFRTCSGCGSRRARCAHRPLPVHDHFRGMDCAPVDRSARPKVVLTSCGVQARPCPPAPTHPAPPFMSHLLLT